MTVAQMGQDAAAVAMAPGTRGAVARVVMAVAVATLGAARISRRLSAVARTGCVGQSPVVEAEFHGR